MVKGINFFREYFKAKAWLDLKTQQENGRHVDARDIKKHRNDIIRITAELLLEKCMLPEDVKEVMSEFVNNANITDNELKNLGIRRTSAVDIIETLKATYLT